MACCVFSKCCCCINLRIGCLIIGYLSLIQELIFIGYAVFLLAVGGLLATHDHHSVKQTGQITMIISSIVLFVILFYFVFTIVLLVGIHKNKRGHVKAYLIVGAISMTLALIAILASFAGPYRIETVIEYFISYIINVYFLLVIRSHFYKMNDDVRGPAIYRTA